MREKTSPLGFYTIGIAALFLLGFLLLTVFGAQVYQETVTIQDENDQTRALRSYLVTCARAAAAGDVEVKDSNDGQVLVIRDSGTDYGLQIFLHDGKLMESYNRTDSLPDPEKAQPIGETSVFDVKKLSEESYEVTTDAGRTLLHVSSIEEAGQAEDANTAGGGDAR